MKCVRMQQMRKYRRGQSERAKEQAKEQARAERENKIWQYIYAFSRITIPINGSSRVRALLPPSFSASLSVIFLTSLISTCGITHAHTWAIFFFLQFK